MTLHPATDVAAACSRSGGRLSPFRASLALAGLLAALAACGRDDDHVLQAGGRLPDPGTHLFTLLPSSATGVRFENRLTETNERNVFTYRNYYNGGGVALGDLSGDGTPDLVLTSNEDGPRLFLNAGGFRFRDVTRSAGIGDDGDFWSTGVALADVNGDGRLDVYVCRAGPLAPARRANALWINQGTDDDGVPTFREMGAKYGVADQGYSTHAAFLDYDRDGDLDLFVINNSPRPVSSFGTANTRHVRDAHGGAQLYRNDGGRFTNVSAAAGIHSPEFAFGLGVAVSDLDRDGWPDVYVGNDFFERDYLYRNNGDGTFTDVAEQAMPVLSYFSMGLDVGDLDNDGWPDVYTTDMLPEDDFRLKTTSSFENWESYQTKARNGFHHQLSRNMLQRNNRDGTFSDVAHLAGVAATDWTWSALIADLDLDGRPDIYVTNGMAKDITSQDYLMFLANDQTMKTAMSAGRGRVDFLRLTSAMKSTPLPNYAFRNAGELRFENAAGAWGLDTPGFSSGAAYGDLDGDGAPDLVVNNVNGEALVYRNNARSLHPAHRSLRVRLVGTGANTGAFGARVTVYAPADSAKNAATLTQELAPSRGFQSSVEPVLVFGLGARDAVDSLRVEWPDGRASLIRRVAADTVLTLRQADAAPAPRAPPRAARPTLVNVTARTVGDVRHDENEFVDFDRERLLPKMLSTEGPHLAVADVNGDGLDDAYLGGAKGKPGTLLLQQRDGRFTRARVAAFEQDAIAEDVGAVFFHADGDGAPDLYVVSGGNEYSDGAPALQDRLYLNDGRGGFRRAADHLPAETHSGSRAVPRDYDGDGDVDLFVGGRVVPWRYGMNPGSMLLRNDGRGRFQDVTGSHAPGLRHAGMVTDASWQDVDGDARPDLVVVGEWMPVSVFRNRGGGRLEPVASRGLERSHGWWNRIVAGDFTGDGRVDFVVGNLGLNSRMRASDTEPATLHVKDFDGNGFSESILSWYSAGVSRPMTLRDDLGRALPMLRPRLTSYEGYAAMSVADIFTKEELRGAIVKEARTFESALARNNGDGSFTLIPLPREAQVTPLYGLLAEDVDGDGRLDLLAAGNFHGLKPEIGRLASGFGLLLRGDGAGGFIPVRAADSGFRVDGEARDIQRVRGADGVLYLVSRNDDTLLAFRRQ